MWCNRVTSPYPQRNRKELQDHEFLGTCASSYDEYFLLHRVLYIVCVFFYLRLSRQYIIDKYRLDMTQCVEEIRKKNSGRTIRVIGRKFQ